MHVLSGDISLIDVVGDVDGFVGVVTCSLSEFCGKYVPAARTTERYTLNVTNTETRCAQLSSALSSIRPVNSLGNMH